MIHVCFKRLLDFFIDLSLLDGIMKTNVNTLVNAITNGSSNNNQSVPTSSPSAASAATGMQTRINTYFTSMCFSYLTMCFLIYYYF